MSQIRQITSKDFLLGIFENFMSYWSKIRQVSIVEDFNRKENRSINEVSSKIRSREDESKGSRQKDVFLLCSDDQN